MWLKACLTLLLQQPSIPKGISAQQAVLLQGIFNLWRWQESYLWRNSSCLGRAGCAGSVGLFLPLLLSPPPCACSEGRLCRGTVYNSRENGLFTQQSHFTAGFDSSAWKDCEKFPMVNWSETSLKKGWVKQIFLRCLSPLDLWAPDVSELGTSISCLQADCAEMPTFWAVCAARVFYQANISQACFK